MKKINIAIIMAFIIAAIGGTFALLQWTENKNKSDIPVVEKIKLPEPKYDSGTSIEKALLNRRSIREYKNEPLKISEVSQLLWAAQGITDPKTGFRTAPSAGALYPIEIRVIIGNVEEVASGIYKYAPQEHELLIVKEGDIRDKIAIAANKQTWIEKGAIIIVFSAVYERTTQKYGDGGVKFAHIEVGHAAQNAYLQAVSLNLGMTVVGGFNTEEIKKILSMPDNEDPLYIAPIGRL